MRNGLLILVLFASSLSADELYSTLRSNAELGRVFLTPAERANLDWRRQQPDHEMLPAAETAASQDQNSGNPSVAGTTPIGYIKSSSGKPMKWEDGDFVPLAAGESLPRLSLKRLRTLPTSTAGGDEAANDIDSENDADDDRSDDDGSEENRDR